MIDKTYRFTHLDGLAALQEKVSNPVSHSLSGWAITKIDYLDKSGLVVMDGALMHILTRVLAVAVPIFALLDFLSTPGRLIFAATKGIHHFKQETLNAVKLIALTLFGLAALPIALVKPACVYRSNESWKKIKQEKLVDEMKQAFQTATDDNLNDPVAAVRTAISKTLPSVVRSSTSTEHFQPIIELLMEQLEKEEDSSSILAEHLIDWISLFLVNCQDCALPIDAVDPHFFQLMHAVLHLKNPTLREDITKTIIADYALNNPVVEKFKAVLDGFEKERLKNIEDYRSQLQAVEEKQEGRIQASIHKITNQIEQEAEKSQKNERKLESLQNRLAEENAKLAKLQDNPAQSLIAIEQKVQEKFPPFPPTHFTFLSLYFLVLNAPYSKEYYAILKMPIFKQYHQRHYLLNFLMHVHENKDSIDQSKVMEALKAASEKGDSNTLRFIKNSIILMQLKEWDTLEQALSENGTTLDSESFISELFMERFDLSDIDRYQGEAGQRAFTEDYDKTFGTFRDTSTIMVLYSTLCLLDENEKTETLEGLKRYVIYVLQGGQILNQQRHSEENSIHLSECYSIRPEIKALWENPPEMKSLGESDSRYASYRIGEATDPCDLLMSAQEVVKSCLHPAGRPNKVKGFLGSLLDGKIHPVIIKGPGEKIAARMFIKLMLTEDKQKIVLQMGAIYTNTPNQITNDFYKESITEYCQKRAEALGIPLVSITMVDDAVDIGSLESLQGLAPFEHVDGFEGPNLTQPVVFKNGQYTFPRAYTVPAK
jgi:uncharacterized coiled-coil protein SlyX